ncbi:hypothetical protein V8F33_004759, partial [Rhypophila sp. PSN 637]
MDLLPDVGTWLLRSVRRTGNSSDNPISVVERLNSLPHPLRNADKDTLVGAVLTLGPSLQLALHMLMELLPEDESRGRLGEVLHAPRAQPPPPSTSQYSDAHSHLSPQPSQAEAPLQSTPRPSTPNTNQPRSRYSGSGGHGHPRRENPAADLALMKELRAEMRVNAAIQVAVDSLEFADGQMKIVRDVHRLHGSGSFELLQKHFYE